WLLRLRSSCQAAIFQRWIGPCWVPRARVFPSSLQVTARVPPQSSVNLGSMAATTAGGGLRRGAGGPRDPWGQGAGGPGGGGGGHGGRREWFPGAPTLAVIGRSGLEVRNGRLLLPLRVDRRTRFSSSRRGRPCAKRVEPDRCPRCRSQQSYRHHRGHDGPAP